jgi:hypothetical protein
MGVFSFALLICFSMVLAPSMFSQSASTGAISGTLRDSSGSSVPNATVTLTSLDTNQTRTTTTTPDGTYRFGFLNSGAYKLRFEATGFNSVVGVLTSFCICNSVDGTNGDQSLLEIRGCASL